VCVHGLGDNCDRDQRDRGRIQSVLFVLFPPSFLTTKTELQGQDSTAVIGEMRDSLIDNWA